MTNYLQGIKDFVWGPTVAPQTNQPTEGHANATVIQQASCAFQTAVNHLKDPLFCVSALQACNITQFSTTLANHTLAKTFLGTAEHSVNQHSIKVTKGEGEETKDTYSYEPTALHTGLKTFIGYTQSTLDALLALKTTNVLVSQSGELLASLALYTYKGVNLANSACATSMVERGDLNAIGSFITSQLGSEVPELVANNMGHLFLLGLAYYQLKQANSLASTNAQEGRSARFGAALTVATIGARALNFSGIDTAAQVTLETLGGVPTGLLIAGGIGAYVAHSYAKNFIASDKVKSS